MAPRILGRMVIDKTLPAGTAKLLAGPEVMARSDLWRSPLLAVIRVRQPGHVPKGVELRQRLGPDLFTARIKGGWLERTLSDPLVAEVEPSRSLVAD